MSDLREALDSARRMYKDLDQILTQVKALKSSRNELRDLLIELMYDPPLLSPDFVIRAQAAIARASFK